MIPISAVKIATAMLPVAMTKVTAMLPIPAVKIATVMLPVAMTRMEVRMMKMKMAIIMEMTMIISLPRMKVIILPLRTSTL